MLNSKFRVYMIRVFTIFYSVLIFGCSGNGNIEDTSQVDSNLAEPNRIDTTVEGRLIDREYYPSGELKNVWHFLDGKLDSSHIIYYKNGVIKEINNYDQGRHYGNHYTYDEEGSMTSYFFINSVEEGVYQKVYDDQGKLQEENGTPIFYAYNRSEVRKSEEFSFFFNFALAPECELRFSVVEMNQDLIIESWSQEDLETRVYNIPGFAIKRKMETLGKNDFLVIWDIKDTVNNMITSDTTIVSVNVVE